MGRRQLGAWIVLLMVQLVVIVSLAWAGPDGTTHRAQIRIVAPPVVATSLVEAANALPGRPLVAEALATAADARASVRTGRSAAAVVVDLSKETDIVYVASANGTALNHAVEREVDRFEGRFGRTAVVRDLVPAKSGDAGHRHVYGLAGLSVLVGLLVAIVITWRYGPWAETFRDGAKRLAVAAAVAVAGGGIAAGYFAHFYGTGFGVWWLIATLTILASTTITLGLQSLFGVVGLGVAMTLVVLTAAPLVTLVHPLMVPQPWATITPWLPHGAALDAGTNQAYFAGSQVWRPLLILAAWIAISVLTTITARRNRPTPSTPTPNTNAREALIAP